MSFYIESYDDVEDKYKTILRQYVDYQEEASYKIEKLEKASNPDIGKVSSKFNIKTKKSSKKDVYEKNEINSATSSNLGSENKLETYTEKQMEIIHEQEPDHKEHDNDHKDHNNDNKDHDNDQKQYENNNEEHNIIKTDNCYLKKNEISNF